MATDKTWLYVALAGVGMLVFMRQPSAQPGATGSTPGGTGTTGPGGTTAPGSGGSLISPVPPVPIGAGPAINVIPVPGLSPAPSISTTPLPTAQQLIVPPLVVALAVAAQAAQPSSVLPLAQSITSNTVTVAKVGAPLVFSDPTPPTLGPGYPADPGGLTEYIATDPASGPAVDAINNGSVSVEPTSLTPSDLPNLSTVLEGLGIFALVADIGFTIAGNAPDAVKAIDTVLDVVGIVGIVLTDAAIVGAALAETGVGLIIVVVAEVVKFVFDLFAGSLFGGLTHAQRQALETARYAEAIHPMYQQIATSYSPRELLSVLISWGSGSCGGTNPAAIITGLHNTPTPGADLYFGNQGCYYHGGSGITFDQQAEWLATKGQTEDFFAIAQSGISADLLATFDATVFNLVTARCQVYSEEAAQGMTLDQMDTVAAEYRRTDSLNRVASIYGFAKWQELFAWLLQPYWAPYVTANRSGSLNGLAASLGYADAIALRDAAFSGLMPTAKQVMALEDRISVYETGWSITRAPMVITAEATPDAAVQNYLAQLAQRQATIAAGVPGFQVA